MGKRRAQRRRALTAEVVATALPMVWRYARGMAGEDGEAREVVHEVFRLADPEDPAAGPPTVDEFLARARLACRRGADAGGSGRRRRSAVAGGSPGGLRDQLGDELVAMTADAREALLLLDVLGLEVERAAGICGVDPATLHARRYRAHGRMVARVVGDEL